MQNELALKLANRIVHVLTIKPRCVQIRSTQRMGIQTSGGTTGLCDGTLSTDWLAFIAANPFALGTPFSAGDVVHAQAWYRDPPAVKTTNLSDGVEFVLVP